MTDAPEPVPYNDPDEANEALSDWLDGEDRRIDNIVNQPEHSRWMVHFA